MNSSPHSSQNLAEMTCHDYKPYPAYRDSGIAWLGQVPAHWTILPGRACYCHKKVPNKGMQETTVLSLSYGQIVVKPPEKLHGLVPASFETYQIIEPDDIVIRPTDLQNDWNSLRFGLSSHRGIITSAYMCFHTSHAMTRRYGHLLLHTYDLKKVFYGLGSGLRQNLDWQDFKYLPCPIPPPAEQKAIVRFLDYYDRLIRTYITAKQKLIALLTEQKQAIIHRAITRGLTPDVKVKPSGVDWLGDVPAHWTILPGRACYCQKKKVLNKGMRETAVLSLSYGQIVVKPPEKLYGLVPASFETYQIIEPGDIIIRPTDLQNDWRSLRFGLSSHHGIITSAYMCFHTAPLMTREYGHLLLHTYDLNKVFYGLGSGLRQNLDWHDFTYLPCLVPPLNEQLAVVQSLYPATSRLDLTITRTQRQIALMREYHRRLIADVVTGKVDVREAAARLPEFAPPDLPPDEPALADMPEEVEVPDAD